MYFCEKPSLAFIFGKAKQIDRSDFFAISYRRNKTIMRKDLETILEESDQDVSKSKSKLCIFIGKCRVSSTNSPYSKATSIDNNKDAIAINKSTAKNQIDGRSSKSSSAYPKKIIARIILFFIQSPTLTKRWRLQNSKNNYGNLNIPQQEKKVPFKMIVDSENDLNDGTLIRNQNSVNELNKEEVESPRVVKIFDDCELWNKF